MPASATWREQLRVNVLALPMDWTRIILQPRPHLTLFRQERLRTRVASSGLEKSLPCPTSLGETVLVIAIFTIPHRLQHGRRRVTVDSCRNQSYGG